MDKYKSVERCDSRMSSDSTDDYKTELGSSSFLKKSRSRKRSCVFKEHVHARHLLSGLERLRQNEQLFDVTIKVQDVEFNCHKCLLATLSPYFSAMFLHDLAENKQKVITINGVDPCAMQHLLDYAYTSETFITEENVQSLLSAANLFAILPVRDACCRYLKRHIDEYNCIGINAFAELHSCDDLRDASKSYILNHFLEVSYEEEFVNLCIDKLLELISDDELNVVNELDVLDAILRWYMFDVSSRGDGLLTLAAEVRFPLISPYELEDAIEIFPVTLRDADAFRNLVDESRRYHLLVNRRNEFTGNRFRPRKCQGIHEVILFIGGENDNGKPVNTVKCYNFTAAEWKELCKMPVTLTNFRVASSGDDVVYLCGGKNENIPSQCLYKYEFKFNTWVKMNSMEVGRYDHGVCILDDRLYVIGGSTSEKDLASCEIYELKTNKWTEMPPLLYPVSNPAVCARFPKIYVFGGENKSKYGFENYVQCYDTVGKIWYELSPMNVPRSLASACLLKDEIFVIGGCALNPTSASTDRTEIYNLHTNSWSFGPPSFRDIGCSTSVLLNGKIYLIPESRYDAFTRLEYYDSKDKCFKFANIVLEEAVEKARIMKSGFSGFEYEIKCNSRYRFPKHPCVFREHGLALHLLTGFDRLRNNGQLCDVILKVEDTEFPCHKCVLASLSPYLYNIIINKPDITEDKVITISGVSASTMNDILTYIYTSEVLITEKNAQDLLSASNLFQISAIHDACGRFLKRLIDETNCLELHLFAELHSCQELLEASKDYVLTNFSVVCNEEEFLSLSASKLIEIIRDDDLCVNNEQEVFDSVCRWFNHSPITRIIDLPKVFQEVRFPLLSPYELENVADSFSALFKNDFHCRELLDEARRYNLLVHRRNEFRGHRFIPRNSMSVFEVFVVIGGCMSPSEINNVVECVNPVIDEHVTLQKYPFKVTDHTAISDGEGTIYVSGGVDIKNIYRKDFWKYDYASNVWTQLCPMNEARMGHGMCMIDDYIFVIGGYNALKVLGACEVYDIRTNKWSHMLPLKYPVYAAAVCSYLKEIYVIGGSLSNGRSVNYVQCYNAELKLWHELNSLSISRQYCTATFMNDYIYVIGGISKNADDDVKKCEIFNIFSKKWSYGIQLNEKRYGHAAVVLNEKIYIIGGVDLDDKHSSAIECYDPKEKSLKAINSSFQFALTGMAAVKLKCQWDY